MQLTMKADIHPTVFPDAQVVCTCGNTFMTTSTKKTIMVEVCSKCHPYFTGEHRFIDAKGRVEQFQKKQEVAQKLQATLTSKKDKRKEERDDREPKTLKELLGEV